VNLTGAKQPERLKCLLHAPIIFPCWVLFSKKADCTPGSQDKSYCGLA
jgi:hypothetical protein